jgi:Tfp pilus assembly protein PilO
MKVTLPKLPQLKPRERLFAVAGAVALVIVVMDRLVLNPWLQHANTVRQETRRMEQSLNHYSRLLTRKGYVLAQRERYQRYLRTPLPDELHMAGLLKEMEALAEHSGVNLIEVKPLPPEGDAATRRFSLDVQFDCTLEEWADFLIEIESSPSLFQIVRANLSAQDETPDRLKGSLRVANAALRLKPAEPRSAGP